jgi:outer membrane biosynthesis protein TonB
MKNEYNKTKRAIIGTLGVAVILLAVGLWWYMDRIDQVAPPDNPDTTVVEQTEVVVPAIIKPEVKVPEENEPPITPLETASPEAEATPTPPQTPEEAQEPTAKPVVADPEAITNPDSPPEYENEAEAEPSPPTAPETPIEEQPAPAPETPGGTVNEEGKIFVPGFGYVDPPGAPVVEYVTSDGDWDKQIGTMN